MSVEHAKRVTACFSPLQKHTRESITARRKPSFYDFDKQQNFYQGYLDIPDLHEFGEKLK